MSLPVQQLVTLFASQDGGGAPGGCAEAGSGLVPIVIMMVIFYLIVILPGRKERKQHQAMLDTLKRGDEVVTSSGLFGSVADLSDKVVTLEIAKNVKVRVLRSSIARKAEEPKPADSKGGEAQKAEKGN